MKPGDSRLEALQRYCDGTATPEDVAAVERAIVADAEFRQLAVEYFHLDSAMERFAAPAFVESPAPRVHHFPWPLAAAAAVALMGLALWHWRPAKSAAAQVEIEITQLAAATFAEPHAGLQIHDRVRLDALDLRGGVAQLRLASGVKLAVSGPAELRFLDPMHAKLLHGKVTVDCEAGGQGFTLETPVARVVDVSTQFGVEARVDGATDVMVIKGSVQLFRPQQSQQAAPLEQGEAVRVDATKAIARIENITGGPQPGDWSTQRPSDDCSIVSVSDNFGATEGYHFYRIVPRGLQSGALVYSNRRHVWRAAEGREFPASLLGADVAQTFFGELKRPAYAIEVTLARPVELYILMPKRGLPQPWLTESFSRTGEEIFLDENPAPGRPPPHLAFEVWKRIVPQAGTITLGPGNRDADDNPVGMYGIAARALTP